jgi:hypothetical protein
MELCHSFGVHSGPFVAPPGAIEYEASPGAVEAYPRTLKAYTGAINGTLWSFGAHRGAWRGLSLEPRGLTLAP